MTDHDAFPHMTPLPARAHGPLWKVRHGATCDMAIRPCDAWGPFDPSIADAERIARLRCLRTIVHLLTGYRGHRLKDALWRAETNPTALVEALAELHALEPLDMRRVLASF